jgi:hypothetical protein
LGVSIQKKPNFVEFSYRIIAVFEQAYDLIIGIGSLCSPILGVGVSIQKKPNFVEFSYRIIAVFEQAQHCGYPI